MARSQLILFHLTLLAALFLHVSVLGSSFLIDEKAQELVLFARKEHGAVADVLVGRKCPECVRGMFASRDLKEGEIVLSIPDSLTIDVSGACPEGYLCGFVRRLWLEDPGLKTRLHLFFESLPSKDEVLSAETFNDTMIEALQSPHLARGMRYYSEHSDQANFHYIANQIQQSTTTPITFSDWTYLSSMLTTRTFSFPYLGNEGRLIPVGDFFNMCGQGPNENPNMIYPIFDNVTLRFDFRASRHIEAGEELKFKSYGIHTERADFALLIYGYVDDALLDLDEPQLCATDLPSYDEERIWAGDSLYDWEWEESLSLEQKTDALEFLSDRLKQAEEGESLQDDLKALPESSGWLREVVKFRIVRKKALMAAVERLKGAVREMVLGDEL